MSWLNEETIVIGYECGLVEILNAESRTVLTAKQFENPVTGLCGRETGPECFALFAQLKGGDLIGMKVAEGRWTCCWSDTCTTSISFAKPLLINGGETIVYVRSGQHCVAFVKAQDGKIITELDISTVSDAKGMVTGMCMRGANVLCLSESGVIVEADGKGEVVDRARVSFPVDPTNESIIPTAIADSCHGMVLVGFSSGVASSVSGEKTHVISKAGIGSIRGIPEASQAVVGTWKGHLFIIQADGTITEVRSPHACNICQIAVAHNSKGVAVASTDGRVSVWSLL